MTGPVAYRGSQLPRADDVHHPLAGLTFCVSAAMIALSAAGCKRIGAPRPGAQYRGMTKPVRQVRRPTLFSG